MKIKSAILTTILAGAIFGSALTAKAAGDNATLTFTADQQLDYTNVTENGDATVNLGSSFEGMAPGETRSETITLTNAYDSEVDFYMSTEVLAALEDTRDSARGAGYEVQLTAGDSVLYDSAVGGYTSDSAAGDCEGLNALNDSELTDSVLVATLAQGESSDVVLTITLDGEAMDNTDDINYADALGNISFSFSAGYQDPTGITDVTRTVTERTETKYVTEIVEEEVPLAVKTGDNSFLLGGVLVVAAGIILFLVSNRTYKKGGRRSGNGTLAIVALGTAAGLTLCGNTAQAADTYTVTYRPGNVGMFATSESDTSDAQAAAEEVASLLYADYEYTVTEHGAIKLTVAAGETVPSAPSYVIADDGYFVRSTDSWGPETGETVTQNVDYVADYGKLINGVTYTVSYVDAESGAQIAPVSIASGNIGDTLTVTAPATITVSGATHYNLSSDATASLTLSEDGENVLTFAYTAEETGVNETVITEVIDGGTVVTTQVVQVGVTDQANAGAVLADGQADANADGEQADNNDVVIEDDNTPLADGETENNDSLTETTEENIAEMGEDTTPVEVIEDEGIPLAASAGSTAAAWWIFGIAAAALVVVTGLWIRFNRKEAKQDSEEQ